jgi:hypothetical protein
MTEYSNTRYTGNITAQMAVSAVPVEVPVTLLGDSSAHTMVEGEGLTISWWRATTGQTSGFYSLYLSYDDDGATDHVPIYRGYDGAGFAAWSSSPNEYHTSYPAPAGKEWRVWCLGPNNAGANEFNCGGTITNKQ